MSRTVSTRPAPATPIRNSVPERTCVGCRSKAHRSDLVRLVAEDSGTGVRVRLDRGAVAPGRGAWLHERPDCLDRALARRAVTRALRLAEQVDTSAITEWAESIRR